MNDGLTCSIVQDLLPNYIEKLTSDETNHVIEHHLSTCMTCKEAYEHMTSDIDVKKAPTIELKFLKKVKKTRILAAVLTIALALFSAYFIYTSEYKYTNDKSSLAVAITDFTSPFKSAVDAYVLETKEIDGVLISSFKDRTKSNVNGVAVLKKGFNQRYRIINAKIEPSKYSSVVQIHQIRIKDEPYYVINGYNLSDKIKYYGLDYHVYLQPGNLAKDRVRETIKFDIENQQFMNIFSIEEIESLLENAVDYSFYDARLWETSLYDADGNEITEDFIIEDNVNGPKGTVGKAELSILYVVIAIVLGLGFIITRYFLTI
jgi:hypothetical protein